MGRSFEHPLRCCILAAGSDVAELIFRSSPLLHIYVAGLYG